MLPGAFDKIRAVFLQRLIGSLRAVGGNTLVAPDCLQSLQRPFPGDPVQVKQILNRTPGSFQQTKEQMLHGHKIILHLLRLLLGSVQRGIHIGSDIKPVRFPASGNGRDFPKMTDSSRFQTFRGHFHLLDQLRDQSSLLLHKGQQQVYLFQLLMVIVHSQLLRRLHSFQRLLGIVSKIHSNPSFRVLALYVVEC